jgi:thioredoxin 1
MAIRVLYFSTPDCAVCHSLRPKIQEMVSHFADVEFRYVDCTQEKFECGQNQVFAVPTIILFYENRQVKRFSRIFSVEKVQGWIEKLSNESCS